MAGTIIDMSTIKQMLQLSQDGVSNRQIARQLGISRDKVNEFVNAAHKDSLGINGLLKLEDPILEVNRFPNMFLYKSVLLHN